MDGFAAGLADGGTVEGFAEDREAGAFVGGAMDGFTGHSGSVRSGTRKERGGAGGSVFAGWLAVEPERGGKSFVSGLRRAAVTRSGDNGLVWGLVIADEGDAGDVRRVERGPVDGLLAVATVVMGLAGAGVDGGGNAVRRAPSRPTMGLSDEVGEVVTGVCDKLFCSLFKISCARVLVGLSLVTSSIACCMCVDLAPTIRAYKSSAPFTSINFKARAKSSRA